MPDDTDLRAIIAVGYPGDPSSLPDNLRERFQVCEKSYLKSYLRENAQKECSFGGG